MKCFFFAPSANHSDVKVRLKGIKSKKKNQSFCDLETNKQKSSKKSIVIPVWLVIDSVCGFFWETGHVLSKTLFLNKELIRMKAIHLACSS